jgi:serine/threonine protein kinase
MMACPSAATLARLGTDSWEEALSSIEVHIERCADCQDRLERLRCNDAAPDPADAEGRLLPGEAPKIPGFVIERELGRGSMGVVYLARQPNLGRLVALKVVRSGPAAGSRDYARWLREGRAFSLVRHENVVRLYDVGESGGWLYLVLEYIPGGTLHDRLDVPYAARDAARLLEAIAGAVAAIHRAGLLHLDLKPSNVLLDGPPGERATPRVGDFGLAYCWDDPDATANAVGPIGPIGTPRYMAPEQLGAGRDRLAPAADVYGLGALLYHVVTGRPPFVAPSLAETLEQVRRQEPVPPRRLNPAIPRDLETICLRCLRKEPGQRYPAAQAVADDLRRFLDGRPIAARPASPAEKAWRWCRRRPAVAALAAALAITLVGGFLGMFRLWRQAEAAQARDEADFHRAAELLDKFVWLNAGGRSGLPRAPGPEDRLDMLRLLRRHLVELADRLPDGEMAAQRLMAVNLRLGDTLAEEGVWAELRGLYESSIREARDAIRRFPHAAFPRHWLLYELTLLAQLADREGKPGEVEALGRQGIAAAEEWAGVAPGPESLAMLMSRRRELASALARQRRRAEARELLLANRRSLEASPPAWADERVSVERIRDVLSFHRLDLGPHPDSPADGVGPPESLALLASPDGDRLPPEAWATLAIRVLQSAANPPSATTRRALWFTADLKELASARRRSGRFDEARQVGDRLAALARLLVARNPRDPAAHMVLADAHEQASKNAWAPVKDLPTIRRTLEEAIDANQEAVDLDPTDEVARHELRRRRRRFQNLPPPGSEPIPVGGS